MKNLIFILSGIVIALMAFKYPVVDFTTDIEGGVQFHKGTFKETLQLAKKENKLVFLDIYATWCGPCKKLKAKTFSNAEVGSYYNQHFINVALNGEEGEGLELARKYKVKGYPTLLFIRANGEVAHRTSGFHKYEEFIQLGKTVKNKYQ